MKTLSLLVFTVAVLSLVSCGGEEPAPKTSESLIEVKDGIYTEYYPGRKSIKFRGPQDENELRHGKWYFYSEKGVELSMTEYVHGLKSGGSFVRYPNGVMHYYGEWYKDKQVGQWVTYDQTGKVVEEKNFGEPLTETK
jgi:antitoxin component YwqK of YwqJK toxin-antitoxin module